MDFDPERLASNPFFAGLVGAAITAWKFLPGAGWPERIANACAGSAAAGYLAAPICEYFKVTSTNAISGTAFLLGLLGMSLLAAVLSAVRETKWAEIVTGWLTRKKETP